MSNVTIQKRGKYYQYKFETAKIDGKRKFSSKSGFRTKAEAEKEGIKAYNEYMNTGHDFTPSDMSYSDLLDYWLEKHCYINLKYHTIEAYSSIIKNHIKPNIGHFRISQITRSTLQELTYDQFVELVGGVEGTLKSKNSSSLKYEWDNTEGGYLFATFSVQTGKCTFTTGRF